MSTNRKHGLIMPLLFLGLFIFLFSSKPSMSDHHEAVTDHYSITNVSFLKRTLGDLVSGGVLSTLDFKVHDIIIMNIGSVQYPTENKRSGITIGIAGKVFVAQ